MKTNSAELYSITILVDYAGQHTQRGLAFAWRQSRARKRSRCQGSGEGLGTDTALVFWDTGNCLILSHSARERRLSVCVRGRCPCANLQKDATTRNYLSQHGVGCSPLVGGEARILKMMQTPE